MCQKCMIESKKFLNEQTFNFNISNNTRQKINSNRCYLDNQYYYRSIYYLLNLLKFSKNSNFVYFSSHKSIKRLRYLFSLNSKKKPR